MVTFYDQHCKELTIRLEFKEMKSLLNTLNKYSLTSTEDKVAVTLGEQIEALLPRLNTEGGVTPK